jgi:hypothetical protein
VSHYAFLDETNIVTEVIVGRDWEDIVDGIPDWEVYYGSIRGQACVRTSYTGKFRFNYAGLGFIYDQENDAFIPPKPYPSWSLDPLTYKWVAPIPSPEKGLHYWDEETTSWTESKPNN